MPISLRVLYKYRNKWTLSPKSLLSIVLRGPERGFFERPTALLHQHPNPLLTPCQSTGWPKYVRLMRRSILAHPQVHENGAVSAINKPDHIFPQRVLPTSCQFDCRGGRCCIYLNKPRAKSLEQLNNTVTVPLLSEQPNRPKTHTRRANF